MKRRDFFGCCAAAPLAALAAVRATPAASVTFLEQQFGHWTPRDIERGRNALYTSWSRHWGDFPEWDRDTIRVRLHVDGDDPVI